jgi:hypothetical protein
MARRKSPETDPVTSGIRVIDTKTCPSLSAKGTITYKLGRDPEGTLWIRLHENTGGGFFNDDWIQAAKLVEPLAQCSSDKGISSLVLGSLFRGRSANTQAFFAAVLRAEGVLLPWKRGSRVHKLGDVDAFLNQSKIATTRRKATTQRKPAANAKSTSRRKPKASAAA